MALAVQTERIRSKGQITVPKEVRERLGVTTGDSLEFVVDEDGKRAELRPIRRRSIGELRGLFRTERRAAAPAEWGAQRDRAWSDSTARA